MNKSELRIIENHCDQSKIIIKLKLLDGAAGHAAPGAEKREE